MHPSFLLFLQIAAKTKLRLVVQTGYKLDSLLKSVSWSWSLKAGHWEVLRHVHTGWQSKDDWHWFTYCSNKEIGVNPEKWKCHSFRTTLSLQLYQLYDQILQIQLYPSNDHFLLQQKPGQMFHFLLLKRNPLIPGLMQAGFRLYRGF